MSRACLKATAPSHRGFSPPRFASGDFMRSDVDQFDYLIRAAENDEHGGAVYVPVDLARRLHAQISTNGFPWKLAYEQKHGAPYIADASGQPIIDHVETAGLTDETVRKLIGPR